MAELPNTLLADRSLYAQPTATQGAGRYRWYVLAVLTIAQGCHALDRSVIGLVLEPVKIEFGLTDGEAGVLAGLSYGIAFALAAIPFGIAVDRFKIGSTECWERGCQ